MVDEFIRWPKPYLLSWATCDEILSWMIEISNDKYAKLQKFNSSKILQGMANNVGLTLSDVGDTTPCFTNSSEQDN